MTRWMFCIVLFVSFVSRAQVISTVAGNGSSGYSGDGSAATSARLNIAAFCISDASGNLYISDYSNNVIRKVSSTGLISTIAGTGVPGFTGDGGQATAARLNGPSGIGFDVAGNIYFADRLNNRLRKIDPAGIITTFAGSSTSGFGGDGGPATAAALAGPFGLAVDIYGRVFFSDRSNNRIRVVDSTTGIIRTVAGDGTAGYSGDGGHSTSASLHDPAGICVDRYGNVFVADHVNNVVRVAHYYGLIETIAGNGSAGFSGDGGAATAARFDDPLGVSVNDSGEVFVADANNNRIRRIDTGGRITTVAGTGVRGYSGDGGPAPLAQLNAPISVMFDSRRNLYICDAGNHVVRHALLNHAPVFTRGHHQTISVCENSSGNVVDTLFTAIDSEVHQNQRWTVVSYPPHGYLTGSFSALSTGSAITPSVYRYTPIALYSGFDTFSVRVSDGYFADTTNVIVRVIPLPLPGYVRGSDSTCPGAYDTLDNPTATPGGRWSHTGTFITIDSLTGIVHALSPGRDTVVYTITTICGSATARLGLTVNDAPFSGTIIGPDSVCRGDTIRLSNPTATPGGRWTSSDPGIATVDSTGLVRGMTGGTTYIFYNAHTYCGSAPALHRVDVRPYAGIISGRDTVCLGDTIELSNIIYTGFWITGSPSVASVSNSGVVTARSVGAATISYTRASGACGSATVTHPVHVITLPSPVSLTGATTICRGATSTLTASVSGGAWRSSDTSIATVAAGVVGAVNTGSAIVTYSLTNFCGTRDTTATVTVITLPVVAPLTGSDSVCAGASITITSATPSGIWALSNSNATLGSGTSVSRIVNGVATGFDTLSYRLTNACGTTTQTKTISIRPQPDAGTITGASSVCTGDTIRLTATASTGVWSVSNSTATVSSSGVVTGRSAGTDTVMYAVTNSCGTAIARHPDITNTVPFVASLTGGSTLCVGSTITLASATGGGAWIVTNAHASVASGVVRGLSLGRDTIIYTVTNICGSDTAMRIVTINPLNTPTITSAVSLDSVVCTGDGVTFTAVVAHGGSSPYLRWLRSGIIVASGTSYSYMPSNGDAVKCVLVSSDVCALQDTFSSNTINMTVHPLIIPSARITANPNDTVTYRGQPITFTTSLAACGPSPIYQWFLNGIAVSGATDSSYTVNVYTDDTVFCIVSCNLNCASITYNHTNTIVVSSTPLSVGRFVAGFEELVLFPNPNNREFTINGAIRNLDGETVLVEVMDMTGRVLYHALPIVRGGLVHHRVQLYEGIATGSYLLRIAAQNGVKVFHFVIAD